MRKAMPRVLIVTREYPPIGEGGISRRLSQVVPRLLDLGFEIGVVTFSDFSLAGEAVYPVSQTSKILYTQVGEPTFADLASVINDIRRLDVHASEISRLGNYDIIHIEEPIFGPFIRSKLPKVVTVHNTQVGELIAYLAAGKGRRQLRRSLFSGLIGYGFDSLCLRSCDRVIAVSPIVRRQLVSYYHLSPSIIEVVPNGVELPSSVAPSRKKAGSPTLALAFVGRLVDHKRVDVLLKALAILKAEGAKDFRCFVVGIGPSEHALKSLCRALSLDEEVEFTGRVSDERLAEIYSMADAFVSPSIHEGWGLTVFEAASYGCAPVVSRIPVFSLNLVNGSSCLMFDPNSPSGLSRELMSLYRDPVLLGRIQKGARAVSERMDWNSNISKLAGIYSNLCPTFYVGPGN
jgi:glycosyltransferase involved in cell wall biosynthesis